MKRIWIVVGVLLFILLLAGGSVYRYRRVFSAIGGMRAMPDALRKARVVSGEGLFSKAPFYSEPDLGLITDIRQQQDQWVIVGQRGAALLTGSGSLIRRVHFDRCTSDVVAVEVGAGAFLCRGAWSKGAMLFDSGGKTLWSYGGGAVGVDDAAAGALGTNGSKGIVAGLNGDGGVRLLNPEGKESKMMEMCGTSRLPQ